MAEHQTSHKIRIGMKQITARENGGCLIVEQQKLRHKFGEGYEPRGPKRTIYEGKLDEAVYVAEILQEVFESDG